MLNTNIKAMNIINKFLHLITILRIYSIPDYDGGIRYFYYNLNQSVCTIPPYFCLSADQEFFEIVGSYHHTLIPSKGTTWGINIIYSEL